MSAQDLLAQVLVNELTSLAGTMPSRQTQRSLNRSGKTTGKTLYWILSALCRLQQSWAVARRSGLQSRLLKFMRILVADDHAFVRAGICRILASDPTLAICGEAVDGLDAIQKAADTKPDLVLLDITMPHLDGFGAAREIKRILPTCQIVIVSQLDSPTVRDEARKAGAIGYVDKSDLSTQLLPTLARLKQKLPPASSQTALPDIIPASENTSLPQKTHSRRPKRRREQ